MALDEGYGKPTPPPKKKKRRPAPVVGERGSKVPASTVPSGVSQVEENRVPYRGSSNPAFARVGYAGDIFSFNARVQAANHAFATNFGYEPSPGLLLDLVRAPVGTEEYQDLFKMPTSFQRARAAAAIEEEMRSATGIPKQEGGPFVDEIAVEEFEGQREQDVAEGKPDILAAQVPLADAEALSNFEKYAFGVPVLGIFQVAESLAQAPAGVVALGAAGYADYSAAREGDFSFKRSREIGKAIGQSVAEDFRHPLENPGYLFLDVLGVASAGAGTVARVGAASRAGRAARAVRGGAEIPTLPFAENLRPQTLGQAAHGRVARSVLSGLVRRPNPGTFTLGPKGAEEHVLLSENALRRATQRLYYTRLQHNLMERLEAPSPETLNTPRTLSAKINSDFRRARQSVFSAEKTLGRTAAARVRTEKKVMSAPIRQFEMASRASNHLADVFRALPLVGKKVRGESSGPGVYGLSIGDQMAIMLHATGGTNPAGFWRDWHTKMIEWGIGDPEIHRAKLAAVALGEKAFENPSKRLTRAIEASRRLSEEQQLIKIERLGLSVERAENRLATERAVLEAARDASSEQKFLERVDEIVGGPPLARKVEDSWYYPQPPRSDADIRTADLAGVSRSSGVFGHPVPDPMRHFTELTHRYEAKAIMAGDTVVDASQLAAKYAMATRVVTTMDDYKRLLALSVETPKAALKHQRGFYRAIRTLEGVPDELRAKLQPFFEDRIITADEMADLMGSDVVKGDDLKALHDWMYPEGDPKTLAMEGVRWVDERFVVDLHRFPGEPSVDAKFMTAVNEPLRASILYARLGYSLNALSNAGMLLIQQGHLAPLNMGKSLLAGKVYGAKALNAMDALIDDGRALSFTPDDIRLAKVSRSGARLWNRLVDRWMRRAALIYELERKGYKSGEDIERLLDPRNEKGVKDRVEISRRANKAMVEFDNLTWFEKNRLRHYIFVYPWVSRASVWSVRTMLEHPLKTWALSELGQEGEKYVTETLEEITGKAKILLPDWFVEGGYIPTGGVDDEGNPRIINANSVNTFSTFTDVLRTGRALVSSDVSSIHSLEDMLGPVPELGLRIATGRNQYGQKYEHGAIAGGIGEIFSQLPYVRGFARPKQERTLDTKGRPAEIKSSYQLVEKPGQIARPGDRPVLTPGIEEGWGPLVSNGLWPGHTLDVEAAEERYWKEQPKEARDRRRAEVQTMLLRQKIKDEIRTIRYAEDITSKIMGQPVPKGVRKAIGLQERFQNAYLDFAVQGKKGRMPTDAEQRYIQIDVLERTGRVNPDVAADLRKDLDKAVDKGDIGVFTRDFADRFLFADELRTWHRERDTVLEIANNLPSQAEYLRKAGLFTGVIPKAKNLLRKENAPDVSPASGRGQVEPVMGTPDLDSPLYALGRAYLEYERKLRAREAPEASFLEGVEGWRHKVWMDEQDKPVNIDGVKYPSPVRLKWASDVLRGSLDDPDYETKKLSAFSVQSWDTLTDFEKEVVGRKPAKGVSKGWLVYEAVTGGYRGSIIGKDVEGVGIFDLVNKKKESLSDIIPKALAGREVSREHKLVLAKWVDKFYAPGFYKDFLFAVSPKVHRVERLPVIKESPNKKDWQPILGYAQGYVRAIEELRAKNQTGIGDLQTEWKDYATRTLYPWLQSTNEIDPSMKQELERLGGVDFLRGLID